VQNLRFGGRSTQSQYQIVLQSLDADEARSWSVKLADAMKAEPQTFVDVASDLQNNALQASIDIDRDKAGSLGISSQAIRSTLEAAYGTLTVSQIQTTGNSYDVILELDQSRQWDETQLGALRVPSSSGTLVPLASFATIKRTNGPVTVNQSGQLASVTLSFNLPAGVSLGTATDRVTALRTEIGMPASVSAQPSGAAQIFAQSTGNMGLLILAAVATIYIDHCADRVADADRYRQEKCDHDGRCRAVFETR
jgi:HAE1 family hydrophobic/amphiphilic exporter-1